MNTKVKMFNECYSEELEKEVNTFLKNVDLVDIKYSVTIYDKEVLDYSAMVIYKELSNEL